jgi:hypothetical protein
MKTITVTVKDNSTTETYKIKVDDEELNIFLKVIEVFDRS